ncbi:MAG: FCD domain-containing protein, partial [Angelakisella sp.]
DSPNQQMLADLEEMMGQMREALAAGTTEEMKRFKMLEARLHLRIIQEVMTPSALGLLYEIRVHLTRWTNIDVCLSGMEDLLMEQNQELLDAIRGRKLQKALFKIKEHYQTLVSNADMVRSVHPDYFRQ